MRAGRASGRRPCDGFLGVRFIGGSNLNSCESSRKLRYYGCQRTRLIQLDFPMKWLDNIPYALIVPLALVLALAPFAPEPHLWEKLKMLFAGTLSRPIDIFDLFLHGTPLLVLMLKLGYSWQKAR